MILAADSEDPDRGFIKEPWPEIFFSYLGIIPWLLSISLNGVNTENIETTPPILPGLLAPKKVSEIPALIRLHGSAG